MILFKCFLLLLIGKTAFAAELSNTNQDSLVKPSTLPEKTGLTLSFLLQNFDYNESLMTQKGPLVGLGINLRGPLVSIFSAEGNLEALTGRADYLGSTWTGNAATTQNQFYVAEAAGHFLINLDSGAVRISPLLATGIRYTYQDKESGGDYRRQYDYVYGGFGARLELSQYDKSSYIVGIEYDVLWQGANTTYLTDVRQGSDVKMDFTQGNAFRLMAEYDFLMQNDQPWKLILSYVAWNLAQSMPAAITNFRYVYEPANQTYLTSLSLGYTFR